jgi:hypothetical protein
MINIPQAAKNVRGDYTNKKDLIEYLKGIYWLLFEASAA